MDALAIFAASASIIFPFVVNVGFVSVLVIPTATVPVFEEIFPFFCYKYKKEEYQCIRF